MWRLGKFKLSIPQRLLLLTLIPLVGLLVLGQASFRAYYAESRGLVEDTANLKIFHDELTDFVSFASVLSAEQNAALLLFAHRDDPQRARDYEAHFAATDRAITAWMAKLDRIAASPVAPLFAEKSLAARTFFASQIPEARTSALSGKRTSGEVFYIYLKLAYSGLFVSECYRQTIHSAPGLNFYDAILAMEKIQQQELFVTALLTYGLQNGGLQKDELAILRRQFFVSTESEYYMLKFQPELRAYFRDSLRKTEDDAMFYTYLNDLAGTQAERTPLLGFTPKNQSVTSFIAGHFQAYEQIYAYAFSFSQNTLADLAAQRERRAFMIGAGLLGGICLSLGFNLAITRSTKRHLANVSNNIAQASDDVKSASTQLTSAGEQMSKDANRYASAIEKISSSLTQVSTVAETNKNHAATATATTTRARDSVDAGLGTIQELDLAMNSARNSGQKINQVIARINDLSFQTNLLALNAAVEAGRAGEAGAGFAVVADEVRQLAGRCAEAAKETAELIGESSKDTATAITKSDELATRFKSVSHGIHEVSEIVTRISANFMQQATSIAEISHSVSRQREIAQSMAAAAQETASTAFSMENQVGSLRTSVERMDHLLGKTRPANAGDGKSHETRPRSKIGPRSPAKLLRPVAAVALASGARPPGSFARPKKFGAIPQISKTPVESSESG
jgi:methyl-accepting chemotaxis protein